jgi:hypothetical protein
VIRFLALVDRKPKEAGLCFALADLTSTRKALQTQRAAGNVRLVIELTLRDEPDTDATSSLRCGRHQWEALLLLALRHGWRPQGSASPNRDEWHGDYREPRGQLVPDSEARALSIALRAARSSRAGPDVKALHRRVRKGIDEALAVSVRSAALEEGESPQLQALGLNLEAAWKVLVALEASLLAADDSDEDLLDEVVNLAARGAFYID